MTPKVKAIVSLSTVMVFEREAENDQLCTTLQNESAIWDWVVIKVRTITHEAFYQMDEGLILFRGTE